MAEVGFPLTIDARGVAKTPIRGDASDFLGQYWRNSHALLTLRYSF